MKTIHWTFLFLLLTALLQPTDTHALDRNALVEIMHYDGTVEYKIMPPEQARELHKEFSKEKWHFRNALKAAAEEWEQQGDPKFPSMPPGLRPRKVKVLTTDTDAQELSAKKRKYDQRLAEEWSETTKDVERHVNAKYPIQHNNRHHNRVEARPYTWEGDLKSAREMRKIMYHVELAEIKAKQTALANAAVLLQKHIDAKLDRQASQNAAMAEREKEKQEKAEAIQQQLENSGSAF